MDFKTRNPNLTIWTSAALNSVRSPFPFDGHTSGETSLIAEVNAPDNSAIFLIYFSHGYEDENYDLVSTSYMIETSQDCVMRKAFEVGDITWQDFWYHKGWLIELTSRLSQSTAKTRYIHPNDMHPDAKQFLEHCGSTSPLMFKHEVLFFLAKQELRKLKTPGPDQQNLDNFLLEYGVYLERNAA